WSSVATSVSAFSRPEGAGRYRAGNVPGSFIHAFGLSPERSCSAAGSRGSIAEKCRMGIGYRLVGSASHPLLEENMSNERQKSSGCLTAIIRLFIGNSDTDDWQDQEPEPCPYRVRDDFLSAAERSFYQVLLT